MGYFNIIESLRDKHIDEDMLSVSGVNSNSIDSLLKALNKMDAKYLKGSDVKVDTEYYFNNSPFSRDCNKVEKLLRNVRIGHCYFYKEGKNKIRFGCHSLSRY